MKSGCQSFVKDAHSFAEERKLHLQLDYPEPALIKEDGELITGLKVKAGLDTVRQRQYQLKMEQEKWQGKLIKNRWDDNNLDREGCFAWLPHWKRHLRIQWQDYMNFISSFCIPRFIIIGRLA